MTNHLLHTAVWVGAVLAVAVVAGIVWLGVNRLLDALIGDEEFTPLTFRDGYITDRDEHL